MPRELECGVVGAVAMMVTALGDAAGLAAAVGRMVAFEQEVAADPARVERYDRMTPILRGLYRVAQPFYAELDALTLAAPRDP
jgi:xylulokinase